MLKEEAPVKAAKIPQRNLSGIVMFRQLPCDKIHSFHSVTSFLLVTIVSLMPNWSERLISTEWVKRCRCPEPQNHMLRVKGPSSPKAPLLQLWCGPIRGRTLQRRIHREAPVAYKPPEELTLKSNDWSVVRVFFSGRDTDFILFHPDHYLFHYRHCHIFSQLHNH